MFWNKIVQLCNEHNTTPTALVKSLGIAAGSVTKWKNGVLPRSTTAAKIADHFGVTVDYLLGNETEQKKPPADIGEELSEGQRKLIEFARSVPEDQIDLVLKVMQSIVEAD